MNIVIDTFSGKYDFLSNFYPCKIKYEGVEFPSVEHAFQAMKTMNRTRRNEIAQMSTAGQAKRAGRGVILRDDWESVKDKIMYDLNKLKFQNPELAKKLLETGDRELIEGNTWGDDYWGMVGDVGENKLGKILMRIRTELLNYKCPECGGLFCSYTVNIKVEYMGEPDALVFDCPVCGKEINDLNSIPVERGETHVQNIS